MTPETLRKAVELADGWSCSNDPVYSKGLGEFISPPRGLTNCFVKTPHQTTLDALAAQLVRQVDATDKYRVCVQRDCSTINSYEDGYPTEHGGAIGRDNRTENTINAIVESGVLSNLIAPVDAENS